MRFTIERIRTLVLAAGVLLLVAIAAFLAVGKWKSPFSSRDIPKRLGMDIEQEANGVTYTQAHDGHTLFKIHASKVVQLKNGHAMLHDVQIELYGTDGSRVDRIAGDEFEYDQKVGQATAAGPVQITLMRPGVKPAIASEPLPEEARGKKARASSQTRTAPASSKPTQQAPDTGPAAPQPASSASAAPEAADTKSQIEVKTSGLVFNQQTGVASTKERVNFSSAEGNGSSMGATYESQNGLLVLDHSVELITLAAGTGGKSAKPIDLHADHAEFERDTLVARLHAATAKTETEVATAADAKLLFRNDGSIAQVDATGGFSVTTTTGAHLAAPTGTMKFDEDNDPRSGHLEGGVQMDSNSGGRVMHGSSSTMDLEFTVDGDLRHAHLERAVEAHSQEKTQSVVNGRPVVVEVARTWRSAAADVEFRQGEKGRVEPATIHGTGGVVITSESRRGDETPVPAKLAADEVSGVFGSDSTLTSMTGTGHAKLEETAATGALESATGDRLEAHFLEGDLTSAPQSVKSSQTTARAAGNSASIGAGQLQSAVLDGHVVLVEQPASQPNSRNGAQPQATLRATAGKAEYEGAGEWLHLTVNPRVDDGGLQLTADKVDVAQASGDAFAHGNVKATWTGNSNSTGQGDSALGGKGPAHAIAAEAELRRATGEATFTGHARLWQDANSVAAPVIVLDREKQTLTAKSSDAAEPVGVVMLSAGGPGNPANSGGGASGKSSSPSLIRVTGGDLRYSAIERRARIEGGSLGPVVVVTGGVQSTSSVAELFLTPAGTGGNSGNKSQPGAAQSQVDHMTASGHVVLTSQGRRGTGEQLAYTGSTGDYVLTGTASAPPRMTDPVRGSVTGEALIFHSRNDSVDVEGGGQKTRTDTNAPQ